MNSRLNPLSSITSLPRDLRLLFLSLFLWTFGLGIYNYVWSIYLRNLNANPGQVGLVYSIGFITAALTMIPGGLLANRYELRLLIIISWAMSIPTPIIYYYAQTWTDVLPGLIILQLSAFSLPAFNAYIGAAATSRNTAAFGSVYSAAPLGIVFSPAVGGIVLNWLTIRDLFLVSCLFFTLSTIVLFPVKPQPPIPQESKPPLLELPKSSLEKAVLVLLAGGTTAYSISAAFLPLYFQDSLHLSTSEIQLLGAAQSLGGAVFAILISRKADQLGRGRALALGLVAASLGLAGVGFARSFVFVLPAIFLFGSARPGPSTVAYSILSTGRKNRSRGGRFGLYLTLEQLGFVIGSYSGGFLYSLNPTNILTTTFFSFILLATLGWFRLGTRSTAQPEHARGGTR